MIAALRAEFRKLLTVRSTYIITILALLLMGFIAFWAEGYKSDPFSDAHTVQGAMFLGVGIVSVFWSIIAVLLVSHEYRYNTIMYSLTSARSRSYIFWAKAIAMVVFSALATILTLILTYALLRLGIALRGHGGLIAQHIPIFDTLWRVIVYGCGSALFALLVAFLLRNIVTAVVLMLLLPTTLEQLLALIFRDYAKYLPFTALHNVVETTDASMSAAKSALVFGVYLIVLSVISWLAFLRRNAN